MIQKNIYNKKQFNYINMILLFYLLLIILPIITFLAIDSKDLLYSIIFLSAASLTLALLFFLLQAPDIAITEASVNAGLLTIIFLLALEKTKREE